MPPAIEVCYAVTFGLGGHCEYYFREGGSYSSDGRLSGYDDPESWKPRRFEYRNTVAIDGREMFERHPILAFKLPMIGNLPDGKPDRFLATRPDVTSSIVLNSIAGQPDIFGQLAREALGNPRFRGLDTVSPNDYAALVRPMGARIGVVSNEEIVWEASR
jgi:hypothetical protein